MALRLSFRSGTPRADADRAVAALGPGGGPIPHRDISRLPLSSPFTNDASHLVRWVIDDVFGEKVAAQINDRASAMRLPGIARGVNLVKTHTVRNPLVTYRGPALASIGVEDEARIQRVDPQPSWVTETRDGSSPELRNAGFVDDHIFYGWTCTRRYLGADGFPLACDHINFADWYVDDDNRLVVGGVKISHREEREWALIPGLHEGILVFGADVIRDGRDIQALVKDRLENPVPDINLAARESAEDMTDEEWQTFVDAYVANRKINKGVGFTNKYVEAVPMPGREDSDLMIGARNAAVVDQARIVGVHAGLLDATAPKASLNYETQTGRNQEFVDLDLVAYFLPFAARFSMNDWTPRGQRVAFDTTDLTGPLPGAPASTPGAPPALPAPEETAP